ncbi:MAG: isoprenylcysteine carboxylmethyltransferase family protein [Anaerolineae bacterium]|nr:isoprenylcysteine carboxylmethyltransferase family protein [Anaerolineae bacterium]
MPATSKHDTPDVITLPPLIFAAGGIAGILLNMLIPLSILPDWLRWAGIVLVVLSLIPGPWALLNMMRAGTHPEPTHPTTALVTNGPFRFSRNPIYLTFTLFFLGFALITLNLWLIAILPVVLIVLIKGVIEREECYLERKFGEDYRVYKGRVRRWI